MTQPLVFIDGDQGTTGLQIHERLQGRDDLRLLMLPAAERKDAARRAEAINACDILCLPDEPARQAVASIRNPKVQVIDASSAHRTTEGWVYGFPEMTPGQDERIAGASRVSNPAAIRPAPSPCCACWSRPACCRPTIRWRCRRCRAIRAAAAPAWTPTKREPDAGAAAVPGLRSGPGAQAHAGNPAPCGPDAAARVPAVVWRVPPGHRADRAAATAAAAGRRGSRRPRPAWPSAMPGRATCRSRRWRNRRRRRGWSRRR